MQVPHSFQRVIAAIREYDGASTTILGQTASLSNHLSLSETTCLRLWFMNSVLLTGTGCLLLKHPILKAAAGFVMLTEISKLYLSRILGLILKAELLSAL